METRVVQQVRVYKLVLNRMTSSNVETGEIAAIGFSKQSLIDWVQDQKADATWTDGNWHKTFKQGSILEWFNPVSDYDSSTDVFGHGIYVEWVNEDFLMQAVEGNPALFIEIPVF